MCECTPPYETSPSRCTSPPRSRARRNAETSASFSKNEPSAIGAVDALEVLVEHAAGADRQVADLGVAHLARRQADRLAGGVERRVRVRRPEPVEDRRVGELDRVPRPRRGAAPAVEDDERYERERAAAWHIAANDVDVERRAADERAVDVRLGHAAPSALSGFTEPP